MKKEIKMLISKKEEQKCWGKIQTDLKQYQSRVKGCEENMDYVKRQFEMEGEQARMDIGLKLRTRLGQGAELSLTSVAIMALTNKLETLTYI